MKMVNDRMKVFLTLIVTALLTAAIFIIPFAYADILMIESVTIKFFLMLFVPIMNFIVCIQIYQLWMRFVFEYKESKKSGVSLK